MARTQPEIAAQSYSDSLFLLQKTSSEPIFCECARIGSRALADGSMPILRLLTNTLSYFDRNNLQAEHQHIIFSQSHDNIGLMGDSGIAQLFQEDPSRLNYHFASNQCLDGTLMRKAIQATGIPKVYEWLGYNCQAYVDSVKTKYNELKQNIFAEMCRPDLEEKVSG